MPRMFNFAWVDASEKVFDPNVHAREDERVYAYEFNQVEGDFASLTIQIKNPRVGLLSLGRKTWLHFSKLHNGIQTPLFFGRLVAIPPNIFEDVIELEFIGRPADYAEQKAILADALRVAPYWDPLFIREDALDDADAVLEARSELWHVDPVTHIVSTSDLLVGEDGVVTFTGDDYYDADMELTIANTPARSVQVTSAINWDNQGAGYVNLTGLLLDTWRNPVGNYSGLISSYTFMGLFNDWPQDQQTYSGGYYVQQSYLINVSGENIPPYVKKADNIDPFNYEFPTNVPVGSMMLAGPSYIGGGGGFDPSTIPTSMIYVPLGWGKPLFIIGYTASRAYTENISLSIGCDVQPVVTMPGEDEIIKIDVPSNKASDIILNELPIGNVGRRSFIDSDRGKQSLEYLINIGRAALIARSRAIRLVFTTNFSNGLPCSLRKNALVYNSKFPGGQILGKIIGIHHALDGKTGALRYQVTIASAIGRGGSYVPQIGEPRYVEEGYVDLGYQQYENTIDVLPTNDISYSLMPFVPNDDGIDFTSRLGVRDIVKLFTIENLPDVQAAAVMDGGTSSRPDSWAVVGETYFDEAKVRQVIQELPTRINMQLKPLTTGPYATDISVSVEDLVIPKQIDLEAP